MAQDVQRSAPEKENVPERQRTQSASASWLVALVATSVRYVPAGHEVQVLEDDAAVAVLYVPAPQTKQSTSASWLAALVSESVRYVPAGHEAQVADAVAAVAML